MYNGQLDKMFSYSAKEMHVSPHYYDADIFQLRNLAFMEGNSTDNYGKPICCIPDYLCASPDLDAARINKLILYTGLKQLYHTIIRTGCMHQQEIIISKEQVGYSDWQCVGIDGKGYIWLGTEDNGVFKSKEPLPRP